MNCVSHINQGITRGALVVGVNDNLFFEEGWFERTMDGRSGILYRSTGKAASFSLDLPGGDLDILTLVSASVTLCGGILRGQLLFGETPIGRFTLETENWAMRRFSLKNATPGRRAFTWIVENTFIPHDILKNGDFREIGLHVAGIRIEPRRD